MRSVLFVCLGNICRSPLAEGVARRLSEERGIDLTVDSAGTGSWHVGEAPCAHSVTVARNNGIDISGYRARQVKREDFEQFDLIVALDESNYNDLKRMGAPKLCKLGMFGFENADVPDPYFFRGFDGFDKVFAMIETCVTTLFEQKVK